MAAPRPLRRLGIATRLTVLLALILAPATTAIVVIASRAMVGAQLHTIDQDLAHELPEYLGAAAARPPTQGLESFSRAYAASHLSPEGTLLVVGIGGVAVGVSPGADGLARSAEVNGWLRSALAATVFADVSTGGIDYRTRVSRLTEGGAAGVLVAAADLTVLRHETAGALTIIAGAAGAAAAVALVGSYLAIRRVLRTVDRITDTATSIDRDRLAQRVDYRGPADEVGRLAQAFDGMLARIDRAFEAQRRLLSNVSHQLRTPLTVTRGHLEVLRRAGYDDPEETAATVATVLAEVERTGRLVDELLLLGRSLEPGFLKVEPIELRSFMAHLGAAARAMAPRRWCLDGVPDVTVLADPPKLRGALLNLVDNAVKATGPDDVVSLAASLTDDRLVLSVADSGRGIDPREGERVFERFQRGASDEQGSGLGLAIVRAVAEAHGGSATIDGTPGRGCTARIELPRSRVEVPRRPEARVR